MKKDKSAFSFAEIMISLVILGIIAMIVIPNLLDSSTTKVNVTAAKKAKYEIAQAATMLQAKCPGWKRCTNPETTLESYLGTGHDEIKYTVTTVSASILQVATSVDGDDTPDVIFNVKNDGTIEEEEDCSISTYEAGTSECNGAS